MATTALIEDDTLQNTTKTLTLQAGDTPLSETQTLALSLSAYSKVLYHWTLTRLQEMLCPLPAKSQTQDIEEQIQSLVFKAPHRPRVIQIRQYYSSDSISGRNKMGLCIALDDPQDPNILHSRTRLVV